MKRNNICQLLFQNRKNGSGSLNIQNHGDTAVVYLYDTIVDSDVSTRSRPKAAEASSKNLMSSSLICLISLKSLKKMKNSITQPYESLHHSSNLLIIKEQS